MTKAKAREDLLRKPWTTAEDDLLRAHWVTAARAVDVFADTLDHVTPLSKGGAHVIENLVPACRPCNSSKGDKLLADWIFFHRKGGI